jgi:hypothetical protein
MPRLFSAGSSIIAKCVCHASCAQASSRISGNAAKPVGAWGCISTIDSNGQTIFVADAHRDNGKRFIVAADEKLTAFLELERVTRESIGFLNSDNSAQP